MPESQEFKGVQPRVYAKFVTRIFVKSDSKSDGRPLSNNAKMVGDEYKRVVLGLSKLHRNKAISRRQERGIDGVASAPSVVFASPTTSRQTTTSECIGGWHLCAPCACASKSMRTR